MQIKHLMKQLKKERFEELILEIFILVFMLNGRKTHGNNLRSGRTLIKSIIAQIIMMLVLINMVLSVKHRQDFGKIKDGLIL